MKLQAKSICSGQTVLSNELTKTLASNPAPCEIRPANTTATTTRIVEAYPNPTRDGLTLHRTTADDNASAPLTVRLYDAYSRVRWEGALRAADQRLSTRELQPGVYFLHVVQNGKVLDRQQIEVQP